MFFWKTYPKLRVFWKIYRSHLFAGIHWTTYPGPRIAHIPYPWLRKVALALWNLWLLKNNFFAANKVMSHLEFELNRVQEELALGVRYIIGAHVEGEVAEFGTQYGITASYICKALADFRSNKTIHLFDSFQGLPLPTTVEDLESPHVSSGMWSEGAFKGLSPSELRKLLKKHVKEKLIHIYVGWFKDTLNNISPDTKFAMLHIDCDLFESANQVLTFLFENKMVSEGCIIFYDDYNCNRASPNFGERKAWSSAVKQFNIDFSDGGSYSWAGHKFYVHSYT